MEIGGILGRSLHVVNVVSECKARKRNQDQIPREFIPPDGSGDDGGLICRIDRLPKHITL